MFLLLSGIWVIFFSLFLLAERERDKKSGNNPAKLNPFTSTPTPFGAIFCSRITPISCQTPIPPPITCHLLLIFAEVLSGKNVGLCTQAQSPILFVVVVVIFVFGDSA